MHVSALNTPLQTSQPDTGHGDVVVAASQEIRALQQAIAAAPESGDLYYQLGNACIQAQDFEAAQAAYAQAKALLPNHPVITTHWAMAMRLQGNYPPALEALETVMAKHPDYPKAFLEASGIYRLMGNLSQTQAVLMQARANGIAHPQINTNLASLLAQSGDWAEATALQEASCHAFPEEAIGFKNWGSLYLLQNEPILARKPLEQAVLLAPNNPEICHEMGLCLKQMGHGDEARQWFEKATALDPHHADYHLSLAQLDLQQGNWESGWQGYQWRLKRPSHSGETQLPTEGLWQGQALGAQTLLLHAEQGFGDTMQFVRFVQPLVLAHPDAQILLRVPPALVTLLQASALPVQAVLSNQASLPAFDVHLPLMSLPLMGGWLTPDMWPAAPYLSPPVDLKMQWKRCLNALPNEPKIGLAWTGRSSHGFNGQRSLPEMMLAKLLQMQHVQWVSLQPGHPLPPSVNPTQWHDWTQDLPDFAHTAALIASLDAVVTIDTSIAHLAGAMGKPVLLLLALDPDWRWGLQSDTTPWYPKMGLFRQKLPNDWASVLEDVCEALKVYVPTQESSPMPPTQTQTEPLRLNMGCGQNPKAGYVNVDKYGTPEVQCDLEAFPWPWADNTVDEMVFNHVLEHLGEQTQTYLGIIKEIYRVCRDGALVKIVVPHPRHDDFLHDPTHVRAITIEGLRQFSQAANRYWKDNGYANTTLGLYHNVDFEIVQAVHLPAEPWKTQLESGDITTEDLELASRRYNNVIKEIHVTLKVLKPA